MITDKDIDYLGEAYRIAKISKDNSVQNGAIIVDNRLQMIVGKGWNDFPTGVLDTPERRERPQKYLYTEHAERSAVHSVAWRGLNKSYGCTMYACWFACADCARAIIQAGITRVVGHKIPQHGEHAFWDDSIEAGMNMLKEAGVELEWFEGTIGTEILFKGELINV